MVHSLIHPVRKRPHLVYELVLERDEEDQDEDQCHRHCDRPCRSRARHKDDVSTAPQNRGEERIGKRTEHARVLVPPPVEDSRPVALARLVREQEFLGRRRVGRAREPAVYGRD